MSFGVCDGETSSLWVQTVLWCRSRTGMECNMPSLHVEVTMQKHITIEKGALSEVKSSH